MTLDGTVSAADPAIAALIGELLARGLKVRIRVTGHSMRPGLRDGDLVTLQPVTAARVHVGDLLLVRGPGDRLLLHRLIGTSRGGAGTRVLHLHGDALAAPDAPVGADALLGRAWRIERAGADGSVALAGNPGSLWWQLRARLMVLRLLLRRWRSSAR